MKTIPHTSFPVHVGVDVAKASLQVDLQGKSCHFPNIKAGHADLSASLPAGAMVVLEATGSYHLALTKVLQTRGIPVAVVNPARVRQFARARGTLAKTDPVDAALLSAFGRAMDLQPTPPQDENRVLLKELVNLRDSLVGEITRWDNLVEHQQSPDARRIARAQATGAQRAMKRVEQQIAALLKAAPSLAAIAQLLDSCIGIGPVTTAVLVAEMPELGTINRRQAAALAGLAPHANDSGMHQGKRMIRGGRPRLKRALYLAALCAVRYNPALKPFYQSLRKAGKPAKVALIAVARRLIVILNAKLKEFYQCPATESQEELPRMGHKTRRRKLLLAFSKA
jgi:transposase